MLFAHSDRRGSSIAVALILCSTASAACTASSDSASSEEPGGVAVDEQAITTEVAVPGQCLDFGPGAANPLMKVTPVTFRVQVYKTLVRVWVPEVSPGVEFMPLGRPFSGRDEYRAGNGPASNPGLRTVNYRYWKLPHASAGDPVIELALDDGPLQMAAGSTVRVHDYQIVTRFDESTGDESLWVSMKVADWYREWGGPRVDNRFPYVVCQGYFEKLPAPGT